MPFWTSGESKEERRLQQELERLEAESQGLEREYKRWVSEHDELCNSEEHAAVDAIAAQLYPDPPEYVEKLSEYRDYANYLQSDIDSTTNLLGHWRDEARVLGALAPDFPQLLVEAWGAGRHGEDDPVFLGEQWVPFQAARSYKDKALEWELQLAPRLGLSRKDPLKPEWVRPLHETGTPHDEDEVADASRPPRYSWSLRLSVSRQVSQTSSNVPYERFRCRLQSLSGVALDAAARPPANVFVELWRWGGGTGLALMEPGRDEDGNYHGVKSAYSDEPWTKMFGTRKLPLRQEGPRLRTALEDEAPIDLKCRAIDDDEELPQLRMELALRQKRVEELQQELESLEEPAARGQRILDEDERHEQLLETLAQEEEQAKAELADLHAEWMEQQGVRRKRFTTHGDGTAHNGLRSKGWHLTDLDWSQVHEDSWLEVLAAHVLSPDDARPVLEMSLTIRPFASQVHISEGKVNCSDGGTRVLAIEHESWSFLGSDGVPEQCASVNVRLVLSGVLRGRSTMQLQVLLADAEGHTLDHSAEFNLSPSVIDVSTFLSPLPTEMAASVWNRQLSSQLWTLPEDVRSALDDHTAASLAEACAGALRSLDSDTIYGARLPLKHGMHGEMVCLVAFSLEAAQPEIAVRSDDPQLARAMLDVVSTKLLRLAEEVMRESNSARMASYARGGKAPANF